MTNDTTSPTPQPVLIAAEETLRTASNQIDSGAWTYVYDAMGRRIQKSDSSGNHMEDYYDVAGHMTTEYYNGTWARSELYAGGMRLATYIGGETAFVYSDWLGSHRTYADQTGAAFEPCTNLPFGDGMSCNSPQWDTELFTGDEHDAASNTEHTDFRQLATTQGRWLSPDPYNGSMDIGNPQSLNRYAYVGNDPVGFVDPSGLEVVPCAPGTPANTICTNVHGDGGGSNPPSDIGPPAIQCYSVYGGPYGIFLGVNCGGTFIAGAFPTDVHRSHGGGGAGSGNKGPTPGPTKKEPNPNEACGGMSLAVNVGGSATGVIGLNTGITLGVSKQGITSSYGVDGSAGSLQASAGGGVSIQDLQATKATAEWAIMPPPIEKASLTIPTNGKTGLQGIGVNVGVGVAWPPGAAFMYHNNTNYSGNCLSWQAIGDIAEGIWRVLTGN